MSVTGLAGMINLKGLEPEILASAEIFAGTKTLFRLRLHNKKVRLPSFLIRVERANSQGVNLPVIAPCSTIETYLPITFPQRGMARIDTIKISSPFPVNFFTRFWIFNIDTQFVVFPRLVHDTSRGGGVAAPAAGGSIRRERGQDGELESIAAYSGREPLRAIHWKLSARGNDLLVKEFGSQSMPPLVIDVKKNPGNTLEDRISKAAWLVRHRMHECPVGLRLDTRTIAPATGKAHGALLLKELALYGLD